MKLENQVVNRKLSQKIEKLGVKQESLWWWRVYIKNQQDAVLTNDDYCKSNPKDFEHYSAFTVAELGEMLPSWDDEGRVIYTFNDCSTWFVQFREGGFGKVIAEFNSNTVANAFAKMLIYLIENKLIEIPK